jgi:hypothetical protein
LFLTQEPRIRWLGSGRANSAHKAQGGAQTPLGPLWSHRDSKAEPVRATGRVSGVTIWARRKERLMNDEDVGGKDLKFAYTGMALIIAALIIAAILS